MAVIISYKWMMKGHGRVTRIATTLTETGRDVLLVGLRGPKDDEEFASGPHVHGLGIPAVNLRRFRARVALRILKALRKVVGVIGFTR